MTHFENLQLNKTILKTLQHQNYTIPTPIQAQAIPILLDGKDLLGCAQTGTGKTAAFALPTLHRLNETKQSFRHRSSVRTLVLAPTRELAAQIGDSFRTYGHNLGLKHTVIFGGSSYRNQIRAVDRGVDIVVATPGRLLDLIKQEILTLDYVETFIIDEADQMFDMGFINDLYAIVDCLPKKRQTVLFSATMPQAIAKLADKILNNPQTLQISPASSTAERVEQKVIFLNKKDKPQALNSIVQDAAVKRAIVFSRTKHGADRIVDQLSKLDIDTDAIHGDKKQSARRRILDQFKRGDFDILVATDVAARGIDVDGITHVINYDLPNVPESYVHRIGRTARAGAEGIAISFCDGEEKKHLKNIEKLIKQKISIIKNSDLGLSESSFADTDASSSKSNKSRRRPSSKAGSSLEKRSFNRKSEASAERSSRSEKFSQSERPSRGKRSESSTVRSPRSERPSHLSKKDDNRKNSNSYERAESSFNKSSRAADQNLTDKRRGDSYKTSDSSSRKESRFDRRDSRDTPQQEKGRLTKRSESFSTKAPRFDRKDKESSEKKFSRFEKKDGPSRGKSDSFNRSESSAEKPKRFISKDASDQRGNNRSNDAKPSFSDKKPLTKKFSKTNKTSRTSNFSKKSSSKQGSFKKNAKAQKS